MRGNHSSSMFHEDHYCHVVASIEAMKFVANIGRNLGAPFCWKYPFGAIATWLGKPRSSSIEESIIAFTMTLCQLGASALLLGARWFPPNQWELESQDRDYVPRTACYMYVWMIGAILHNRSKLVTRGRRMKFISTLHFKESTSPMLPFWRRNKICECHCLFL